MEIIDVAIIVIIGIPAIIGVMNGFAKELAASVALVAGLALALHFSSIPEQWVPYVGWSFFGHDVDSHDVSFVVSFITIVMGTLMAGRLLGIGIGKLVAVSGVNRMDRLGGLMFGIIRGGVMVTLLVVIAGLTRLPSSEIWRTSALLPTFETFAYFAISHLPENYSRHFLFPSAQPWSAVREN